MSLLIVLEQFYLCLMLNTNMLEDQAIDYYNLIEPLLAIIIVGVITKFFISTA